MSVVLVLISRVIASTTIATITEMFDEVRSVVEMHSFLAGYVLTAIAFLLS